MPESDKPALPWRGDRTTALDVPLVWHRRLHVRLVVTYAALVVGVVVLHDVVTFPTPWLWTALLCLASTVAAAYLIRRLVSKPLADLTRGAERIVAGDDVDLDPGRDDELGLLARSITRLSEQLGDRLQQSRQEAALLQTILDGMSEGVVVCDIEAQVMLVNPVARQLFGLGDDDVVGKHLLEVYRSPQLKDAMDETVLTGVPLTRQMVLRRGNDPVHLSLAVATLRRQDGVHGSVAVLHDISTLHRLEQIRRDFVANVSHELRTPLATITGYAETLLSGAVDLDPVSREFIETIERHGRRLSVMVADLLMLARIEASGEGTNLMPLRISDVIVDVLDDVQPLAKDRGVNLRIRRLSELPPVLADKRRMTQVMRNLIENAITYTDEGGKVSVKAKVLEDEPRVCIQIKDTGIGIEAQHLPRIFERFYRVDEGRSRDAGGSGLGLALVKHMVLTMAGDISVESVPGRGTTFRVTLDIADNATASAPLAQVEASWP
jgi:two-component system, OmpR family, phosphate regulon sensor histidine kinase PhoR